MDSASSDVVMAFSVLGGVEPNIPNNALRVK